LIVVRNNGRRRIYFVLLLWNYDIFAVASNDMPSASRVDVSFHDRICLGLSAGLWRSEKHADADQPYYAAEFQSVEDD
jgi:hypothetical protein